MASLKQKKEDLERQLRAAETLVKSLVGRTIVEVDYEMGSSVASDKEEPQVLSVTLDDGTVVSTGYSLEFDTAMIVKSPQ